MNPDSPQNPREELEAKLTALLLGELPPTEAAALRKAVRQDAKLAQLYARLKLTVTLVRETAHTRAEQTETQPASLKLSEERRQALLASFKTVRPKEFTRRHWWEVRSPALAAVAAVLVIMLAAAALLPALSKAKSKSHAFASWELSDNINTAPPLNNDGPRGKRAAPIAMLRPASPRLASDKEGTVADSLKQRIVLPSGEELAVAPQAQSAPAATTSYRMELADGSRQGDAMVTSFGEPTRQPVTLGEPGAPVAVYDSMAGKPAPSLKAEGVPFKTWSLDNGGRFAMQVPQEKPQLAYGVTELKPEPALAPPPVAAPTTTPANLEPTTGLPLEASRRNGGGLGGMSGGGRSQTTLPSGAATHTAGIILPSEKEVAGEANKLPDTNPPGTIRGFYDDTSAPGATTTLSGRSVQTGQLSWGDGATPGVAREKVPVLGDVPLTGHLYRSHGKDDLAAKNPAANSQSPQPGQANVLMNRSPATGVAFDVSPPSAQPPTPSSSTALSLKGANGFSGQTVANNGTLSLDSGLGVSKATETASQREGRIASETNVYSVKVVGYVNIDTNGAFPIASADSFGPAAGPSLSPNQQTHRSPIVLPQAAGESKQPVITVDPESRNLIVISDAIVLPPTAGKREVASRQSLKEVESAWATPANSSPRLSGGGIQALDGRSDRQDQEIARQQREVDKMREALKISDVSASGDAPTTLMSGDLLRRLEAERIEAQADYLKEKTRLEKLRSLTQEQLAQTLPATVPDRILGSLQEQLTVAEQKKASLEKDSHEDSNGRAALDNSIRDLKTKINTRAERILSGLDTRVAALESGVVTLSNEVDLATRADSSKAEQLRPYLDAKRKLEEAQRSAGVLNMKINSEATDKDLPRAASVEIVDKAEEKPAQSPTFGARVRGLFTSDVERKARVKVERDQSDFAGISSPRVETQPYDPYFVQTEFEAIQSEKVLGKVAKDLNLSEEWARKNGGQKLSEQRTLELLKKSLDLKPVRNTGLIEIGAKSDKPEEAAKIANAVAEAYKSYRLEQRKQLSAGGIAALEQRFKEQEKQVASAQKEVDRLRANVSAATNQPSPQVDAPPPRAATPAPIPQPEVQTHDNAFSTFSLNVSDVSFKLAAASLEKGVLPEPGSIRSEEFINAFDYRDPEPAPGAPLAFAWERARYPFAQNRDLLRFSLKTAAQGRQAGRPLNLVLLLDNSGSMERADRVRIIHEALRVLATQLQPQDTLSVVTFARTARLVVDGVPGSQASQVAEEVSGLTPEGGTNLEEAMNLAYQTALHHYLANGINRVVLLTDGAANLGTVEPETLKRKVEANRKQGIALDCFGIGWEGYNDDLLEVLTRNGDGRYGFINTPEEAATEFAGKLAGALNVAASDVKVQVEFNPARVTAYRQIGYAKHQLTKEQFRDNTVDAAEIAAAEAGNALYAVEVNPSGEGPLATVRVRYKVPGTSDYREHEWAVPYTGNAVSLEQASPAMRLAATASAFSEWLAASPFAAEVTPDRLLGYLSGVPGVYGADARPKKLEWMVRQAKSLERK